MALIALLMGQPQKGTRIDRMVGKKAVQMTLDATLQESFSAPIELTNHPVENGVDITDHVILRPKTLTIQGIITETPLSLQASLRGGVATVAASIGASLGSAIVGTAAAIGVSSSAKSLSSVFQERSVTGNLLEESGENIRLKDAISEFLAIRDAKAPITIVTGLQQYKDYLLKSFTCTRDQQTGRSIRVELQFQELQLASSQLVTVAIPKIKAALPKQEQGRKVGEQVGGKRGQSVLSKLTGFGA